MNKVFCALMLVTATLLGCGGTQGPVSEAPAPIVLPAEPAYAARLRPLIEQMRQDTLTPGLVVVVRSEELGDWHATFGTSTYGGSEPISPHSQQRIGSCTKTWTGTVILQLVGEGRLSLDDPVSFYVAGVPNGDNITITQLLNMRSGLYNYSEDQGFNQSLDDDPQRVWTIPELLAISFSHDPYFPPGEGYHYSNTNTVLLGLIIEQLTGQSVPEAFRQRIFLPLGMNDSSFPSQTDNFLPLPHANGYQLGSNVETLTSQVLSPERQAEFYSGAASPRDWTEASPSWTFTAGAGISTATDLATYVRAMVGGGLLPEDLQQLRLNSMQPLVPDPGPNDPRYGLGLGQFGPVYGHSGEMPGYNTFMGYDPIRKLTIVTTSNLNAAPNGVAPAIAAARLIIDDLYGEEDLQELPDESGPLD